MAQKPLAFTEKSTSVLRHGIVHALLNICICIRLIAQSDGAKRHKACCM